MEVEMFDKMVQEDMPLHPDPPALQFVSFQVAPVADGGLCVSSASTLLDEVNLEFVGEDIETIRCANVDEALRAIRQNLTDALRAHNQTEY
jgi:hypothetical protein